MNDTRTGACVVLSSSLRSVQRDALDLALRDLTSKGLRAVDSLKVPGELLVRSWPVIDQESTGLVARYEVVPSGGCFARQAGPHESAQLQRRRCTFRTTNLYYTHSSIKAFCEDHLLCTALPVCFEAGLGCAWFRIELICRGSG